jgi:hypothetical protein
MMFIQLPSEILDEIITHTLPEGFESISLTCKKAHTRCTAFIERYHALRSRFQNFGYQLWPHASNITSQSDMKTIEYYLRPHGYGLNLMSASDMIMLIAAEPVVARYIRAATFKTDSLLLNRQLPKSVPSIQEGGAVVDLFANSTYLKQANLDWKEYYTTFESDVRERRYSQHGAAFLLTLLPNIKKIVIPWSWKPNDATEKLLEALVEDAKRSTTSLSLLSRFEGGVSGNQEERFDLRWASPFLALPQLRDFRGLSCLAMEDLPMSIPCNDPHYFAERLQTAHLMSCCIDEVGISDFLRHTPSLKTLRYLHGTKNDSPTGNWDICKFVNAVVREAGSHLAQLSVIIGRLNGSLVPGVASIRGFHVLRTLEIPLELVMCNITSATESQTANPSEVFVDLLPDSVAQLALISKGTDNHEQAVSALFRHFQFTHDFRKSRLQELRISCPKGADESYKDQCNRVLEEAGNKGMDVQLKLWPSSYRFSWDGED